MILGIPKPLLLLEVLRFKAKKVTPNQLFRRGVTFSQENAFL